MPGASANVFQEHASLAEGPERGGVKGVKKWGEKSVFHCASLCFCCLFQVARLHGAGAAPLHRRLAERALDSEQKQL